MFVIAFSGKLGSGKTTVSSAVAAALGWRRVGFGDYVRAVVRRRSLKETRENLQVVGTELLEADPREFCRSVLSSGGWVSGEPLIVDGLRHVRTIGLLQELIAPLKLGIVSISIADNVRLDRLKQRNQDDEASILNIEAHSSEQEVDLILRNSANLVIEGEKPLEHLVKEVIAWAGEQS